MTNCPCCSNEKMKEEGIVRDYRHLKCTVCSHEFFVALPGNDARISKKLYEHDVDYNNDLRIARDYHALIQWNHLSAYRFMRKREDIQTVLDVGTYNGFFVRFLRDRGREAFGFDFNEVAIRHGQATYDLENYIATDHKTLQRQQYDCLTAFEVIEHLESPGSFLLELGCYLRAGGYLILSCPSNRMLWRPPLDYPPHHLSRFSPASLATLVEKCGYDVLSVHEQMNVFDLCRNFIGVLFRKRNQSSLKGGGFRNIPVTDVLRRALNVSRRVFYILLAPVDLALRLLGLRYISQVIIARKK